MILAVRKQFGIKGIRSSFPTISLTPNHLSGLCTMSEVVDDSVASSPISLDELPALPPIAVGHKKSSASKVQVTPEIEKKYVHRVYKAIAPHFSSTRYAKWPKVQTFLNTLPSGSLILDAGCGNGKYLGLNPNCYFIGCDISAPLINICLDKGHEVLVADAVNLPYRTGYSDAAISIAVLHHLSSESRRKKAVEELIHVVKMGGLVLITVWAREQEDGSLVNKWTPLSQKYLEEWIGPGSPSASPRTRALSSLVSLESIPETEEKMDGEVSERQTKQERLRTRWTSSLDKIFADIVVEQIQQGNRPNNVFDKKTWNQIREEFNKQTSLSFNNNQLRKHLDVLRRRYHNLQSSFTQNDPMQDPCYVGFDLWEDIAVPLSAQPKIELVKTKECPIYEQLCTIFADSGVDGKYAQSSHYKEFDKSTGINHLNQEGPKTPSTSKFVQGNGPHSTSDKKRKLSSEVGPVSKQSHWNQELGDAMVEALSDMVQSSKLRTPAKAQTVERFTITNCIKALDAIEGIEDDLYYAAVNLFEDPNYPEMFISLQNNYVRLTWLQGKCSGFAPFSY